MRELKRGLCFIAALLFLLEAWLWETLYPLVAKLVAWLPWEQFKKSVVTFVDRLSPAACVFVFIIPAILIFPLKILGVWLMAQHHIFLGMLVFLSAKLVGLGAAAFLFETCKDKLLSLRWMLRIYLTVLKIKAWALQQTAPARAEILRVKNILLGEKGRVLVLLRRLRRRIFQARKL